MDVQSGVAVFPQPHPDNKQEPQVQLPQQSDRTRHLQAVRPTQYIHVQWGAGYHCLNSPKDEVVAGTRAIPA